MAKSTKVSVIILMAITLAISVPQEVPEVEEFLHQAWSNAGGGHEHPPFSGFGEGHHHFGSLGLSEGPEDGHGSENGDVFWPGDGTGIDGESTFAPQENLGEISIPSDQEASSSPVPELSPLIETPKIPGEEINPLNNVGVTTPRPVLPGAPNFSMFGGSAANKPQHLIQGLWGLLNNGQFGNATAGGSGSGTVQNESATGQGTGVANVGPGGFGIGLGIGAAIQTPLGNLAFGQGNGVAVGR